MDSSLHLWALGEILRRDKVLSKGEQMTETLGMTLPTRFFTKEIKCCRRRRRRRALSSQVG